jgi:predicted transcriptional regulator
MNKIRELALIKRIHSEISISHLILESHIILTLFYIYTNDFGSRTSISIKLGQKTSRIRRIMDILENYELIEKGTGRNPSTLTSKGHNFCENIFSYFKILNFTESWDLGKIVLGKINAIAGIPLSKLKNHDINVVKIRDTSLKCGALGASIFETYVKENLSGISIKFFNKESNSDLTGEYINLDDFESLSIKIGPFIEKTQPWLLIASTINKLDTFYFNQLFDRKNNSPFSIVLVASVQSLWETVV